MKTFWIHQVFTKFWKFTRYWKFTKVFFNFSPGFGNCFHQVFTRFSDVSPNLFPGNPMAMKRWWIPGRPSVNLNSPGRVFSFFGVKLMRFTLKFGLNLVKFQNLVKTWWKPGEFPKLSKFPKPGKRNGDFFTKIVNTWLFLKLGDNLVNAQNRVKTWWMPKAWWKPGDLTRFSPNKRKKRFPHQRVLVKHLLHSTSLIV